MQKIEALSPDLSLNQQSILEHIASREKIIRFKMHLFMKREYLTEN